MMMRCSKEEHDRLFPKVQNEPETNQQLEGLPASTSTLQVGLGGTILVWDESPERTQGIANSLQQIITSAGCFHGNTHDDPGSSKPTYRHNWRTGAWNRKK